MASYDEAYSKKLDKFEKKIDDFRKKVKDSEDLKLLDEVLDTPTLQALYKLASKGYLDALGGAISTGKEAIVFHAIKKLDHEQQELAIKIYRINNSNFRAMQEYILGDVRFKNIRHTKKDIVLAWTNKEFRNLNRAKECGLDVPTPYIANRNILIMEFLGKQNIPYPQLREHRLNEMQAASVCDKVVDFMVRLYRDAGLVHSDLSEYNILVNPQTITPVIIDMGQSVTLDHPNASAFLNRDISNIARFFSRYSVEIDIEGLFERIIRS